MQSPTPTASAVHLMPSSQVSRPLRVLVVGPELLANALYALLATIDDFHLLSPISEPDHVLPFIQRLGSTQHSIDVIVLHWSGDFQGDHTLLSALSAAGQRSLIVSSRDFPDEIEFIQHIGAWGLFFTSSSVHHLATALHMINRGQKYFPEILPCTPNRSFTRQRQMVFYEERLRALARSIMWDLKDTEIQIFRHFTNPYVEEIAKKIHLCPSTVRRELSESIYKFLKLISGRPVPNRLAALLVLQEYGVIEYVLSPLSESTIPIRTNSLDRPITLQASG